ncbi:MAG: DUF1648 domain-containing protein [Kurthia sp.]|nr:DUF1648 domain-containing protein [Kurthia sp.]
MYRVLDWITLILWFATTMLLIIFFNRLPAEVPSHYNILGEPDRYANRWFVFFIPALGIALWSFLRYIQQKPQFMHLPKPDQRLASEEQHMILSRMTSLLKNELLLFLTWIMLKNVLLALDITTIHLGIWEFVAFVVILVVTFLIYYIQFKRAKSQSSSG